MKSNGENVSGCAMQWVLTWSALRVLGEVFLLGFFRSKFKIRKRPPRFDDNEIKRFFLNFRFRHEVRNEGLLRPPNGGFFALFK